MVTELQAKISLCWDIQSFILYFVFVVLMLSIWVMLYI